MARDDVYVINTAGDLSSLDPKNGERRWTIPTQGGQLVSVTPTKIYLRSYNLDIFAVDRATGKMVVNPAGSHLRAGLNLRDYDVNIVNRFNDRMYFAARSGVILALRELGQVRPYLLRDPKERPFGYVPPEGINLTPPPTPSAEPGTPAEGQPDAAAGNAAEGDTKKDADKPE